MKLIKFALAMTIALTGCSQKAPHTKSLDLSKLTDSIAPGEDFYLHVNKAWMEEHPLTGEYARFGNFDLLRDTAQEQVRRLVLEVAESKPAEGSVAYKVATIYIWPWTPCAATPRVRPLLPQIWQKLKTLRPTP